MMKPAIQDALNKQINAELHSGYLYLSMAAYFESESLLGMSHWMRVQAQEELGHARRMFDFVCECNGRVILDKIRAPKTKWQSPLDVFEDSYKHECGISARIDSLVDLAVEENDHATETFLQWFVNEQVEEEAAAQAIVDKLKRVGDDGVAIFMIDNELAGRTAEPVHA